MWRNYVACKRGYLKLGFDRKFCNRGFFRSNKSEKKGMITVTLTIQREKQPPEVFLEILQNSQENTSRPENLLRRDWLRCFLANFAKFTRTPFLQSTLGWLLLQIEKTENHHESLSKSLALYSSSTAEKMNFSIKDFLSKCDQIRRKLRILSYLLKKSLIEIFIFLAV